MTIQHLSWGIVMHFYEDAGDRYEGVTYLLPGKQVYAKFLNGGFVYRPLNGKERVFPDRTSMTRWVKSHLV